MQSSSRGYQGYQGYQGYPYVNPVVNDVPSIDAATASRWANLPRRPIGVPGRAQPGSSGAGTSSQVIQQAPTSNYSVPPKRDIDPVVYIELPEAGSQVSQSIETPGSDTPECIQDIQIPQSSRQNVPPKRDIAPVVYIDLPEAGSQVSQSIDTPGSEEPEFVQDTIMYDPFENRRIDHPKDDSTLSEGSSISGSISSGVYASHVNYNRPTPPNTLNLASPSGSSNTRTPASSRPAPNIPVYMTKESAVYAGDGIDGFPISPIPISEFPQPPPAYTEVAATQTQRPSEPVDEPPPRTQVIVNSAVQSPMPVNNSMTVNSGYPINGSFPIYGNCDRKNMICQHCGTRVHTLVIKEVGFYTHLIACFMFFIFFPLVVIVYCSDSFRQKNHYCPNCNQLIGYVIPIIGEKVNYATA